MTIRLLVTARDEGAALNLTEIVQTALGDDTFSLSLHAQRPAFDHLREAGFDVSEVRLPSAKNADDASAHALLDCAQAILARVAPDAVLAGLSTPPDGGIDEAAIARATVPTFVIQDFWGEVNAFFGKAADCYLGLDEEAVRLTRERCGAECVVVGSPRHAVYAKSAPETMRRRSRDELGIPEDAPVYGLFGQGLHHLEGYRRTLRAWASAVGALPGPVSAIYRAHPRESAEDAERTMRIVREAGLECRLTQQKRVEESLAACDVAAGAFSLCNHDAAYLNRFASGPLVAPVSMLFDPEVLTYCRRHVDLDRLPYLKEGLALPVWKESELGRVLASAATRETRQRVWAASQALPDPRGAAARALETIRTRVGQ